ncbi:hypothetical protein HAPAU_11500 [Halalkalicoccus paucihalophilus]|uniref:Uncharacterized protein n=1 Tax=Halalkalicoccus paucihalophilus TaxID=1008153 RepID=A0A151AEI5_9EURY|nr:hypothetical protein [Halalkalicoccus paucihalophilus]KYH26059.1 hypothetical protein HAPAU_11500 [Halalkalicoccus paucihalophilus]
MTDRSQASTDDTNGTDTTRRRVLKTGAGALAAVGAVPLLSGSAAAHFPDRLDIDIRPDCEENRINPRSRGVVPVAVMSTEFTDENGETVRFDPIEEAVRYRFGAPAVVEDGGGARPAHDGHDGSDTDGALVLHFPMEETGFDEDSTEGRLVWERDESGEHGYSGTDEVTVTGGDGSGN